jgi:hypothetical protein
MKSFGSENTAANPNRRDAMQPTNDQIINLAIGRIFRMASRPTQPGDIEEYERCKAIIMDLAEASGHIKGE